MPDPTGTNLTDAQVSRIDKADPLFREFKLADRLQELRKDLETNERNDVVSLSIAGGSTVTLVAPGETPGTNTELTSSLIFVTVTSAGTAELVLPDPTKFAGVLYVVKRNANDRQVEIKHTDGDGQETSSSSAALKRCVSDGTNWYVMSSQEALLKLG